MLKAAKIKNIKTRDIIEGIPGGWFLKNFPAILIVVLLAMCYISVRYDCITAMETVKVLTDRLEVTRTEVQRERSMYMSATSESSMQQMVDSLGLGLAIQERPAFNLSLR